MAFDKKPSTWIGSWSEDGTNVTFPIASVPEMTAAEADATTGDFRKVLYALCQKVYAVWNALAAADRPAKMLIYRNTQTDDVTGVTTKTFTFVFKTSVTSEDVADE